MLQKKVVRFKRGKIYKHVVSPKLQLTNQFLLLKTKQRLKLETK